MHKKLKTKLKTVFTPFGEDTTNENRNHNVTMSILLTQNKQRLL